MSTKQPSTRTSSVAHVVWACVTIVALASPLVYLRACEDVPLRQVDAVGEAIERAVALDVTHRLTSSPSWVDRGEMLELAVLRDNFTDHRTATVRFLGIEKRSSVRVDVPVVYRYGIPLNDAFSVTLARGPARDGRERQVCVIEAPALTAFQPPAIDTAGLLVDENRDFLGPGTDDARDSLIAGITPQIGRIARTAEKKTLVRETARARLVEFVRRWLLRESIVEDDPSLAVYARFADDHTEVRRSDDGPLRTGSADPGIPVSALESASEDEAAARR